MRWRQLINASYKIYCRGAIPAGGFDSQWMCMTTAPTAGVFSVWTVMTRLWIKSLWERLHRRRDSRTLWIERTQSGTLRLRWQLYIVLNHWHSIKCWHCVYDPHVSDEITYFVYHVQRNKAWTVKHSENFGQRKKDRGSRASGIFGGWPKYVSIR